MPNITLRDAKAHDAAFALHVTEACMRAYAEQTWGRWNGRADLDPAVDMIVERDGRGIGLMGLRIDSRQKSWVLEKLYLLPAYQRQGIGSFLLRNLIEAMNDTFFILTHTISPRHHMDRLP